MYVLKTTQKSRKGSGRWLKRHLIATIIVVTVVACQSQKQGNTWTVKTVYKDSTFKASNGKKSAVWRGIQNVGDTINVNLAYGTR